MKIIEYEERYRDDLIFMVLQAKDALGRIPRLNEDLLDIQAHYLERGDPFWLAISDDGRVIGCIGVKTAGTCLWLKRLYVKAALKRQGIGSVLLGYAERFAKLRGMHAINVHVGGEAYFESHAFYQKHGYAPREPNCLQKLIF